MSFRGVLFDDHDLVIGATGAGKGVLVSSRCREFRKIGGRVYFLTRKPDEYEEFEADFKTMCQKRFLEAVEQCKAPAKGYVNTYAVIDEAWAWDWKHKEHGLQLVANAARSYGVKMIVQSQFPTQMVPTVRANCDNLYCFRSKMNAAEWAAKEYDREFLKSAKIPKGRFICVKGTDEPFYGTAWYRDASGNWFGV